MTDSWFYLALGAFIGYLFLTKNPKAPHPQRLVTPAIFYTIPLFISAGFTLFKANTYNTNFLQLAQIWETGFHALFIGITLIKITDAFTDPINNEKE